MLMICAVHIFLCKKIKTFSHQFYAIRAMKHYNKEGRRHTTICIRRKVVHYRWHLNVHNMWTTSWNEAENEREYLLICTKKSEQL